MKIFNSLSNFNNKQKTIVTVGTFDGVHIGHQKIIQQLNKNKGQCKSVILSFFPHPRMVLQKDLDIKLLNTLTEKKQLLKNTPLDYLIIEPFTKEFSRLTALEFTRDILVEKLNISKLIIGYDHRFGRNRTGSFEQLQEFGNLFNFTVEEISVQDIENIAVSSTKIRKALLAGNINNANTYLGQPYMLTGIVVRGKGLGNKYNYPTVNINITEDYKLIPKNGVYIVNAFLKEKHFYGIMNIGLRPTINGKTRTIEVHLLDFKADVYGDNIQVNVLKRIRDEKKFNSIDALFQQIKTDESTARSWINNL